MKAVAAVKESFSIEIIVDTGTEREDYPTCPLCRALFLYLSVSLKKRYTSSALDEVEIPRRVFSVLIFFFC